MTNEFGFYHQSNSKELSPNPEQPKRRIAVVMRYNLDLSAPGTGGAERSTRNLLGFNANWLVISPHKLPEDLRHLEALETRTIQIPNSWHSLPTPKEIGHINEFLKRKQPDHIIFSHPGIYNSVIFLSLPKDLQQKSVAIWRMMLERHDNFTPPTSSLDLWFTKANDRLQRIVGNRVRANLAISSAVATSLEEVGICKNIITIPNQVGGEYNADLRNMQELRIREKFLLPNELGVLIVSRISPNKGLEWISDFYKNLAVTLQKYPPENNNSFRKVKITIIGGAAPQEKQYEAALKCSVAEAEHAVENMTNNRSVRYEFVGPKSKEQLREYYSAYDILLQPSPKEGFSRVPIEAISSGMCLIGNEECKSMLHLIMKPLDESQLEIGKVVPTPERAAVEVLNLMRSRTILQQLQQNALKWSKEFSQEKAQEILFSTLDLLAG